jgi:type IV secretion system protein VirB10
MNDSEPAAGAPKRDPRTLELRTQPRPVARFRQSVIIAIAAIGAIALFGIAWWALDATRFEPIAVGEDLLAGPGTTGAEGLAGLPDSYDDLEPPSLGPPLPGDLGPAVLKQEREFGLMPDAEDEAGRAERLRLAQQARQAREADVFFQLTGRASVPPAGLIAFDGSRMTPADDNGAAGQPGALPEQDAYNGFALQQPMSSYQVMAGSVIAASLLTGINSDLPGGVLAQVTENVYDTATGQLLLIPQGTKIIGSFDATVAHGQSRVHILWHRLIRPDGSSLQLENLPASDAAGYAGLEDEVDLHTWSLVKGVILATVLNLGSELATGNNDSALLRALERSGEESLERTGDLLVQRELSIPPTVTVRPGWPLRIIVQKDLILEPYDG